MRKLLLITIATLTLFAAACVAGARERSFGPPDGVVELYVTGGDIRPMIVALNQDLAPKGVTLAIVDTPGEADIRVELVETIDPRRPVAGMAYPNDGRIEIAYTSSNGAKTLLHELLHCAGMDHEDDPSSVMYVVTAGRGELKPRHIEALRRLSGARND